MLSFMLLEFPWAELSRSIQQKDQHYIFRIRKEHFLSFKDKEFNVLTESKGDDICDTNMV